ncbi:hypothetical protein CICLE_v10030272mg [Citrus x clementina]|uniref:Carboxypeptidase n=1 Tax=Citrus clementina TaxID=85681 RepID=V4SH11_CITCL|nr:hypothetical protein CICLE_v10030272mg [Citrus x clementina]
MELIKLKGFYLGQPNGGEIDQHSGYVTVDAKAGSALFYYFVESANSSTEPLVLWLNGVNICSSLAELGPYPVNTDGKCLSHSKYARNSVKYFIMCSSWSLQQELDFPTRIHHLTMTRTAEDSYTLLVNWFERLPEYRAREFFLAGESYAGHFVPQACSIDPSIQQDFQSNFHQFKRPSCAGDSDGRVPTTSKRHSINKLGALVNTTWYPWHSQGEHSLSSLFLDGKLPSQTRS